MYCVLQEEYFGHLATDSHNDEGFVVTHSANLARSVVPNEEIYISMTATNHVRAWLTLVYIISVQLSVLAYVEIMTITIYLYCVLFYKIC